MIVMANIKYYRWSLKAGLHTCAKSRASIIGQSENLLQSRGCFSPENSDLYIWK